MIKALFGTNPSGEAGSWTALWPLSSVIAGALTTLAFAPFDLSWLVFITLAFAFALWNSLPLRQATISGWLFGMGLQCSGISWIFHSLHTHGSAPAYFAILLIFLLSCYLSLYTGLAVYVVRRFIPSAVTVRLLVLLPMSWILFEWLQGYIMTGFAWMQLGYTQIELPLSGYAPVFGSHAVSGLVAVSAGALVLSIKYLRASNNRALLSLAVGVALLWSAGALLKMIDWTQVEGEPVRVSVIQGNIAQGEKWKLHMKQPTLDLYRELTLQQQDVDLVVWPETAVPDYLHRVQPYLQQLRAEMKQKQADLLLGLFVKTDGRLLNSMVNVSNDEVYHKRHLVPLGEYIPLRVLIEFFNRFVKIPMSDIASGAEEQELMTVAGVPAGITICFEEAFARDVIRDLPEARLLVNVSNDAWFEDSHEPHQHHAIARMRALEAGRYMIRATNTGITSLIGPHGEVIAQLPQFETAVLRGEVQPLSGATPFVRWGDWMVIMICVFVMLGLGFRSRLSAGG